MKIALIPPIPNLESFEHEGIHLMLSHLLDVPAYAAFYAKRSRAGDHLILDNSAHEHGVGQGMRVLLEQARSTGAREVVVPDVLFDYRATVQSSRDALAYLRTEEGKLKYEWACEPTLMLVPQGQSKNEWVRCLNEMLAVWGGTKYLIVVGVSKDYDTIVQGGIARLCKQHLHPLWDTGAIKDVHCLGWPSDLWSIARVAREAPWVRSTDSAKPFVYAKAGVLLEPGGQVPKYPRRDPDYFDEALKVHPCEGIARRNVEVYRAAARDELILKGQEAEFVEDEDLPVS